VRGWADLLETLYADSWNERLGRFRSDFAFRGLEAPGCELHSGLMRFGDQAADFEGHLLRNFRKYACRNAVAADSIWNWLALAQHHGLPTRLLDWTYSPFVALHFATEHLEAFDRDAVIWMVDFVELRRHLPRSLKRVLDAEAANVFTAEMLAEVAADLKEVGRLGREPFAVFLEPPSIDERIVNQFALFSLMSGPDLSFEDWVRNHTNLVRRVLIPAALKWELRDKLDQANVTERVLYPGLDGLSRWLRRQYTPRRRSDATFTKQPQAAMQEGRRHEFIGAGDVESGDRRPQCDYQDSQAERGRE